MSAPEHSSLPWAIDRDERPGMEWNNHIVSATNSDLRICFMSHTAADSNATGEANARLIVAAVNAHAELLAAGKEALRLLGVNEMLEAAIAKAEEPQP